MSENKLNTNKKLRIVSNNNVLPPEFNCFRCHEKCKAECCQNVPIPDYLIKKYKKKLQKKILKTTRLDSETIIPHTHDMTCPFLSVDFKCAIYENRPPICKIFGTEIHPQMTCRFQDKNGNLRRING